MIYVPEENMQGIRNNIHPCIFLLCFLLFINSCLRLHAGDRVPDGPQPDQVQARQPVLQTNHGHPGTNTNKIIYDLVTFLVNVIFNCICIFQ